MGKASLLCVVSDPYLDRMGRIFVHLKHKCPDVPFTFETFLRRPQDLMRIAYKVGPLNVIERRHNEEAVFINALGGRRKYRRKLNRF